MIEVGFGSSPIWFFDKLDAPFLKTVNAHLADFQLFRVASEPASPEHIAAVPCEAGEEGKCAEARITNEPANPEQKYLKA